jgi:release factor glutamine methyltransferase
VTTISPGMTVGAARRAVSAAFRADGLETPELDARVLIGHALARDHSGLVAVANQPLTAAEATAIAALAARRRGGEPVARIVGQREFWGLPLIVTPAVLVPRPDTETVVELALSLLGDDRNRPLRIADLGTGSGAILLALLSELPRAIGVGTDLSAAALDVARANAHRLGLADRALFLRGNYADALAGPFDLVVSNPPYVRTGDIASLSREVREHDPHGALDGGADGLNAYLALAAGACRLIGSGHLVVEIGSGQQPEIEALFAARGLAVSAARHDLSGQIRALAAHPHR